MATGSDNGQLGIRITIISMVSSPRPPVNRSRSVRVLCVCALQAPQKLTTWPVPSHVVEATFCTKNKCKMHRESELTHSDCIAEA